MVEITKIVPQESAPYWYQVSAPVILDQKLSAQSKVVYAIVSGLTRKTGECWASNEYISELLGISKQTVSRCISELYDLGHIERVVEDDYRRTITLRYSKGDSQKQQGDSQKRVGGYTKTTRGVVKNDEGGSQKRLYNITNELDKCIITNDIATSLRKEPSEVKTFIEEWGKTWSLTVGKGNTYICSFGKEGKIIKDLLAVMTLSELSALAEKFFNSDDDFIRKSGYTIGVFKTQIPKLIADKKTLTKMDRILENARISQEKLEREEQYGKVEVQ